MLSASPCVSVIPGARTHEQVNVLARATEFSLSTAELEALTACSLSAGGNDRASDRHTPQYAIEDALANAFARRSSIKGLVRRLAEI